MDEETQEKKSSEIELKQTLAFLKKNYVWIILGIILIFGFYIRAYHLSYPVVGYHNWKETHYLTEARNFAKDGFFYEGLFVPHWDYPSINDPASGVHGDTFPTGPIVTGFLFKIFGPSLAVARLVSIFFVLGAVVYAFLIMRALFRRTDLALAAAALMALNPLLVFFGRSGADIINPGLFFSLFGMYYYMRWIEKPSWKNLAAFSIGVTLGVMSKYPNALIGIPMAAVFPWQRLVSKEGLKKFWKHLLAFALIFSLLLIWAAYNSYYTEKLGTLNVGKQVRLVDVGVIFTGEFWMAMKSFAADNYTLGGVWVALLSALLFLILYIKKSFRISTELNDAFAGRFIIAYLIGAVLWFTIMSFKLKGHSYHQYPLVFLFAALAAFGMVFAASSIAKLFSVIGVKKEGWKTALRVLLLIVFVGVYFFAARPSWERQFNTQFIGLDLAGNYVREHSSPDEAIFHPSHQSYGVLWHADRKGSYMTKNLTQFREVEEKRNGRWVFLYQWGLKYMQEKEIWEYLQKNYRLAQFAYMPAGNGGVAPVYLLLERGGSFNESSLNEAVAKSQQNFVEYEFTSGKQRLFYANTVR